MGPLVLRGGTGMKTHEIVSVCCRESIRIVDSGRKFTPVCKKCNKFCDVVDEQKYRNRCPVCHGKGVISEKKCSKCSRKGWLDYFEGR